MVRTHGETGNHLYATFTHLPYLQGPIAVPRRAFQDHIRITTHVNGEKRQDGTTADLIASIPEIISHVSSGMTLRPGDVIATGTPHGFGAGHHPPRFLRPGDLGKSSDSCG